VKSTSTIRRRHKLVFVFALTILCVALIASVVLLTVIVVRRRLQQQQQQQPAVSDDEDYGIAPSRGHVPPRRNYTSSSGASTMAEDVVSNQGRRASYEEPVSSTPSSRLAVFRALHGASRTTEQPPSTSSSSRGDQRRRTSRRRHPNGRRRHGRPQHRNNRDEMGVTRSAELRRLARIAFKRHLRTSDDNAHNK